jgi:membrane-associated phospholipid phosphatase
LLYPDGLTRLQMLRFEPMITLKRYHSIPGLLAPADWACLFILTIVSVTLLVAWWNGMPARGWALIHLGMLIAYAALAVFMAFRKDQPSVPWIRAFAVVAIMFSLYSTLGKAVFIAIPWEGDAALHAIDTSLFRGITPALWAERFVTSGSLEFFSFCYGFFIPYLYLSILTGLIGRPQRERKRFITGFAILYAVSFIGYLFVPARGPILFNAADFATTLNGGFFHGLVVNAIEASGGPHGAFPSLHVGAAAYACLFDLRYNRLRGLTYLPLVVLIAIATVVLRYHYVVDLIAGLMIAFFAFGMSHTWTAAREQGIGERT